MNRRTFLTSLLALIPGVAILPAKEAATDFDFWKPLVVGQDLGDEGKLTHVTIRDADVLASLGFGPPQDVDFSIEQWIVDALQKGKA